MSTRVEQVNPGHRSPFYPVYLAVVLTLSVELFYLTVWGLFLHPDGSFMGKLLWTATCGVTMGVTIGVSAMMVLRSTFSTIARFRILIGVVVLIGTYCTLLCSAIDAQFSYFGGPRNSETFIVTGVLSSLLGGTLYAWLLSTAANGEKP